MLLMGDHDKEQSGRNTPADAYDGRRYVDMFVEVQDKHVDDMNTQPSCHHFKLAAPVENGSHLNTVRRAISDDGIKTFASDLTPLSFGDTPRSTEDEDDGATTVATMSSPRSLGQNTPRVREVEGGDEYDDHTSRMFDSLTFGSCVFGRDVSLLSGGW